MFAAVAALVVATMISAQPIPVQAVSCQVGSTCNTHDRNGNDHTNSGDVQNEGGREGYHQNHQKTCNDNNNKCTEHTERDR
ncbi:MAG TPA: hypothetical protein VE548_10965 [Nitrososphaeraceae archaeon]|nr:hypothetical protein [Nitrososphaeraceae archaeon]